MAAYAKNFMFIEVLELYESLLHHQYLKPNDYSYPSVLKACGGLGRVGCGKRIHTRVIKIGCLIDVVVANSLVSMYPKCNAFNYAIHLFNEMPDKDVACRNTVISCYYQDGLAKKALELFESMRGFGFEPNSVTLITVISSCARLLDLERGKKIHMELMRKASVCVGKREEDSQLSYQCLMKLPIDGEDPHENTHENGDPRF